MALLVSGVAAATSVVVSWQGVEPDHPARHGEQSIFEGRIVDLQPEPTLKGGRATQLMTVEIERVVIGQERAGTVVLVFSFYPVPIHFREPDRPSRRGFISTTLHDEDPKVFCQFDEDDDDPRDTVHGALHRAPGCKPYEPEREEVVVVLSPSYWSVGSRVSVAVTGAGLCAERQPVADAAWKGLPQVCAETNHLFLIDDQGYVVDGDLP